MMNIAVLVSGGGTNLQALIDAEKRGEIKNGKITCVISSNPDAYALERAKNNGIETVVVPKKDYPDRSEYTAAITNALVEAKADLVVYAGFMIEIIIRGQNGVFHMPQSSLNEMYVIAALLTVMAYYKHRENIKRLLSGTERKTYLTHKSDQ